MEREKALDFLKRVADGIAAMFGNKCEVVIHDLDNKDSSIVYITNKHVTGREVGDKLDFIGTQEYNDLFKGIDLVNVHGVAKNSHLVKTSTFHLEGDDYHFALGINYDYTNLVMAYNVLDELIYADNNLNNVEVEEKDENLEKKLDSLYNEAIEFVGKPTVFMKKHERVEMIRFLHEKGAFSIHKSIPYIAEKMNISRYTIYNYLREIKEKEALVSKS